MNEKYLVGKFESWARIFESAIPIWKHWYLISKYQRDIVANYWDSLFQTDCFNQAFQFAPTWLSQTINPWSFSLFQFTKEIKGSSALEYKILTEVAGYGSQLGKIIDVLEIIEKENILKTDDLNESDKYKINKFKELAEDIKRAKGMAIKPEN